MSNLSYHEYLERFSVVSQTQVREGVETGLYQDSTDKAIYNVVIYTSIDKRTRDEIMQEFFQSYIPEHSLSLVYFTGKKPQTGIDSEEEERNLILIFEPSKTLAEYLLYSPDTEFISAEPRQSSESPRFAPVPKPQVQTLTIKEVSNLFSCLVHYLSDLHARYLFHGDLREATLHIVKPLVASSEVPQDSGTTKMQIAIKGQLYPGMLSRDEAIELGQRGLFMLPEEAELKASGTTRAAAAARMGVPAGQAKLFEVFAEQQGDIYSLALLLARLINPALFFSAILAHPQDGKSNGIVDGSRMLKVGESLVGVLGYPLGPIILECLDTRPEARPTSQEIKDRLKDVKLENSAILEESALSLRRWEIKDDKGHQSVGKEEFAEAQHHDGMQSPLDHGSKDGMILGVNIPKLSPFLATSKLRLKQFQSVMNTVQEHSANLLSPGGIRIPRRPLYNMEGFNEDQEPTNQKSPRFTSNNNNSGGAGFATLKNMISSQSNPVKELKTMLSSKMGRLLEPRGTRSENGPSPKKLHQGNFDSDFFNMQPTQPASPSKVFPRAGSRPVFGGRPVSPSPTSPRAQVAPSLFQQRIACLAVLESSIWSRLPSSGQTLRQTLGETHYDLKQLPVHNSGETRHHARTLQYLDEVSQSGSRTLGYIQYPNNDVYFGWVSQLAKDDLGLLFLASGDVYHGQFRRGRISGQGVYLFADGETYAGTWLDDELHGTGTLRTDDGRVFACRFDRGALVDKLEQDDVSVDWGDGDTCDGLDTFYAKGFLKTKIIQEILNEFIIPKSVNNYQEANERDLSATIGTKPDHKHAKAPFTLKRPLPTDTLPLQKPDINQILQTQDKAQVFYKDYYRDLLATRSEPKPQETNNRRLAEYLHEEYVKDERQSQNVVLGQLQKIYGKLQNLELKGSAVPRNRQLPPEGPEERYWERMGSMVKNSGRPQDIMLSPYRHKTDPQHVEYAKRHQNFRISELDNEASSYSESPAKPHRAMPSRSQLRSEPREVRLADDRPSRSTSRIADFRRNEESYEKAVKATQPTPRTGRRRELEGVSEHAGYNQELRIVMTVKPEYSPEIKRSASKNPKKQEQGRLANILDDLDSELDDGGRKSQPRTSEKPQRSRSPLQRPSDPQEQGGINVGILKKKIISVTGNPEGVPETRPGYEMPRGFGSFNSANLPGIAYDRNHTGFAQVFFDMGERFYGNFVNGLAEGRGAYYSRDGWIVQGLWKKGRLDQLLDSPFSKQSGK